jgi:hypothetical protein
MSNNTLEAPLDEPNDFSARVKECLRDQIRIFSDLTEVKDQGLRFGMGDEEGPCMPSHPPSMLLSRATWLPRANPVKTTNLFTILMKLQTQYLAKLPRF